MRIFAAAASTEGWTAKATGLTRVPDVDLTVSLQAPPDAYLVTRDEWDRQQSVLSSLRASYAERERIIHALCAELAALSERKDHQ